MPYPFVNVSIPLVDGYIVLLATYAALPAMYISYLRAPLVIPLQTSI